MTGLIDYAETERFTDYMDSDGIEDRNVAIVAEVTIDGDEIIVDLSDSAPMVPGSLNVTRSFILATAYHCVLSAAGSDIAHTSGAFRPIRVVTRPGTVTHVVYPAASSMRGVTGFRAFDTIQGALAQLVPHRVPAAGEGGNSVVILGDHREEGEPFVGEPFVGEPFVGEPFVGEPFVGEPFVGEPFVGEPFVGEPFVGEPFVGEPFVGEPFVGEPFVGEPFVGEPFVGEPFVGEPFVGEPFVGEPFVGEPFVGEPFVGEPSVYFELLSGTWGANPFGGGNDGLSNPIATAANVPIEVAGAEFPIIVEHYGLVPDSGGAGKFRGGLALGKTRRPLVPTNLLVRSDRQRHAPYGLGGGERGGLSSNIVHRSDGTSEQLPAMFSNELDSGELYHHAQTGGGGWGDPFDRDPERVLADVKNEKVSAKGARSHYGVVLAPGFRIDEEQSAILRKEMRSACS